MPNLGQEISSINFGSIIGGSLNAIVEAQCQSANTTVSFIRNVGFYPRENGEIGKPIYVSFQYDKEVAPYQPPTKASYQVIVEKGGTGYKSAGIKLSAGKTELPCTVTVDPTGAITAVTLTGPCSVAATTAITINAAEGSGAELTLAVTPAVPAQESKVDRMLLQVPVLTMLPIPFIKIQEATKGVGNDARAYRVEYYQLLMQCYRYLYFALSSGEIFLEHTGWVTADRSGRADTGEQEG